MVNDFQLSDYKAEYTACITVLLCRPVNSWYVSVIKVTESRFNQIINNRKTLYVLSDLCTAYFNHMLVSRTRLSYYSDHYKDKSVYIIGCITHYSCLIDKFNSIYCSFLIYNTRPFAYCICEASHHGPVMLSGNLIITGYLSNFSILTTASQTVVTPLVS